MAYKLNQETFEQKGSKLLVSLRVISEEFRQNRVDVEFDIDDIYRVSLNILRIRMMLIIADHLGG